MKRFRDRLPPKGLGRDQILQEIKSLRQEDYAQFHPQRAVFSVWSQAPTAVYPTDHQQLAKEAADPFYWDSQTFIKRQPSQKRFSADIKGWAQALLDAPTNAETIITMGGTESNSLAVKGMRDWASSTGRFRRPYRIVAPHTIHFSVVKAAQYFDVDIVKAPLSSDCSLNLDAFEHLVDAHTIGIAGSAPEYCYGIVDPLRELSDIAKARDIWLHVDACVGGAIAPFMQLHDATIRPVSLTGMPSIYARSVSLDFHKHTYSPMGISSLTLASQEDAQFVKFNYDDWPCGHFEAATFNGGRPASVLAATWAQWRYLGEEGLIELGRALVTRRDQFIAIIDRSPDLHFMGTPIMTVFSVGSSSISVPQLGGRLRQRGWVIDRVQNPDGLHFNIDAYADDAVLKAFDGALAAAIDDVKSKPPLSDIEGAQYA